MTTAAGAAAQTERAVARAHRGRRGYHPRVDDAGPDALELLRAASGLSIDEEGRFLHRGEPITHARTLEVLWRSLRPATDGRWEVAIGRERGYVAVPAGGPFAVRGVTAAPDGSPLLHLPGGEVEPLDPASLRVGADGVLRCTVRRGPARFTRAGQVGLAPWLREDPTGVEGFFLLVNGRRWPVHGQ